MHAKVPPTVPQYVAHACCDIRDALSVYPFNGGADVGVPVGGTEVGALVGGVEVGAMVGTNVGAAVGAVGATEVGAEIGAVEQ